MRSSAGSLNCSGKRRGAPFSKGAPKPNPKAPGPKRGPAYGREATRPVSVNVYQHLPEDCLLSCPKSNGWIRLAGKAMKYQMDLPRVKPETICAEIHFGRLMQFGEYVQGREGWHRPDALRVGNLVLMPMLIGAAVHWNKVCGMRYGRAASVLGRMFGATVSRLGFTRALLEPARLRMLSYEAVKGQIKACPIVYVDETGCRVNGRGARLHAAPAEKATTVYTIEEGRGCRATVFLTGADCSGSIGSDGSAPHQEFEKAKRQACLSHPIRRCE